MANPISNRLLWLAVAVVVLVNGVILSKVALNRSDIIAQLSLTERELSLPNHYGFAREDSGKRMSLKWTTPNRQPLSDEWRYQYRHTNRSLVLSERQFASFQFGPCQQRYRRQQRSGWVLLEFNGQSYRDYLAQAEHYYALVQQAEPLANEEPLTNIEPSANKQPSAFGGLADQTLREKQQIAAEFLQAAKHSATRLLVIDAAASPELLQSVLTARQTTVDARLVIVPAEIQPGYARCNDPEQASTNEIIINRLGVESLYVPKHLAQALPQNKQTEFTAPFQATVNYGKLNEPWISGLEAAELPGSE